MTAQTTAGQRHQPPPGRRPQPASRWLALACIAIAQLMVALDATVINIALPSAQQALRHLRSAAPVGGHRLHARVRRPGHTRRPRRRHIGRRRAFLIGLAGFALASAAGGAAPTFGALLAARAVQGACAALLTPTRAVAAGRHLHQGARSGHRRSLCSARSQGQAAPSACCSAALSPSISTGAGACSSMCRSRPSHCSLGRRVLPAATGQVGSESTCRAPS